MIVASGNLLGLEPDTWTAIGTIALVLVTAAYVILTWKTARDASRAAQSAATAAEAAQRSAEIQLAQLPIEFDVSYRAQRSPSLGVFARLAVECAASTVYFHELRLFSAGGIALAGEPLFPDPEPTAEDKAAISAGTAPHRVCPPMPSDFPEKLPHLMHRGEVVERLYPGRPLDPSIPEAPPYVEVIVHYSLTADGDVRSIRRAASIDPTVVGSAELLTETEPSRAEARLVEFEERISQANPAELGAIEAAVKKRFGPYGPEAERLMPAIRQRRTDLDRDVTRGGVGGATSLESTLPPQPSSKGDVPQNDTRRPSPSGESARPPPGRMSDTLADACAHAEFQARTNRSGIGACPTRVFYEGEDRAWQCVVSNGPDWHYIRLIGDGLGRCPNVSPVDIAERISHFAESLPESERLRHLLNANPLRISRHGIVRY